MREERGKRKEERKTFCIKIIDKKTLLVPYTLGRSVAFSMLKKPIGYLLWIVFCDFFFFAFSLYVGKGRRYTEGVGMLSSLIFLPFIGDCVEIL
jgi:uncharacterized membrane protein